MLELAPRPLRQPIAIKSKEIKQQLVAKLQNPERDLTLRQRRLLALIAQAIFDGDIDVLDTVAQSYATRPEDFNQLVVELEQDLGPCGITIEYELFAAYWPGAGPKRYGHLCIGSQQSHSNLKIELWTAYYAPVIHRSR